MKWTGMVCILWSGISMGFAASRNLHERKKLLFQIIRFLTLTREEIRCGNVSLCEAFLRMNSRFEGKFASFLELLTKQMRQKDRKSFTNLFQECIEENWKELPLIEEEKEAFKGIGSCLGYLDVTAQIKELDRLLHTFQEYLDRCKQEMRGQIRLYRSLGIMGTFMLIILIW